MKKEFVLFACLILLPLVSASFALNDESILKQYTSGEYLQGKINLDLNNEPAYNQFTCTFPGNISLISLIKENGKIEGEDYTCSSQGCVQEYKVNQQSTSSLDLSSNSIAYVGFNLTGKEVSVQSAGFSLSSDAGVSCTKQLSIDVLNLGNAVIQNNQYSTDSQCSDVKEYGCFSPNLNSNSYSSIQISQQGLCEKLTLRPGPAFEASARITNTTGTNALLSLELYDENVSFRGGCDLPEQQQQTQEVSCIINNSVTQTGIYYLCIKSDNDQSDYQIRSEEQGAICGTADIFGSQETVYDYELSARPLPYAQINNLNIGDAYTSATSEDLAYTIDSYIESTYSRNCSAGCIVPFALQGINQKISFSNVSIKYESSFGNIKTSNQLATLTPVQPKINADNLELDISYANFVTSGSGNKKVDLLLGGKKILNNSFYIDITAGFNFTLAPKFVLLGIPNTFTLVGAPNLSTSVWNFGDGSQGIASGNSIVHSYNSPGNYTIEVTATSTSGVSAKRSFTIIAGNAKTSAINLYNITAKNLNNVTQFIDSQPTWIKPVLQNKVDIASYNSALTEIKSALDNASSDSEYGEVVTALIDLNMPESIQVRRSGSIPLAVSYENADPLYLESISQTTLPAGKEDEVKDAMIYWANQHYNPNVVYSYITIRNFNGEEEYVLSNFNIKFNEQVTPEDQANLFINYPLTEVVFDQNYNQVEAKAGALSGVTIPIRTQQVNFAIPEGLEVQDLGMFISPSIERLGSFDTPLITAPKYPTKTVVFLIILIIVIFFILYILVQEWYKRRYEKYLFKNPDDLYNVINFIFNARTSKFKDDETKKKLGNAKWSGEQINYAFRKLDGKRTGMYEIPIFKFIERKKVKQEIAKRQPGGERFIKR